MRADRIDEPFVAGPQTCKRTPTTAHGLTRAGLRTPKAAAIAGLIFSILVTITFAILRLSVTVGPDEPGEWLADRATLVGWSTELVPFAGLAFLWFIGVLRDRLGDREDRFVATVFLGSGLMFLSGLFALAAITSGIVAAWRIDTNALIDSSTYHFARATAFNVVNAYMMKMAMVFIITASTLAISTRIAPRWLAIAGYGAAIILAFGGYVSDWSFLALPAWVALISSYLLAETFRSRPASGHIDDHGAPQPDAQLLPRHGAWQSAEPDGYPGG
jgi:hypothetical protein